MKLKSPPKLDKASDRIYLTRLHEDDFPHIIPLMDQEAAEGPYSKIIAKVPASLLPAFIGADYRMEACVPGLYNDEEDVFFAAKYFSEQRKIPEKEAMAVFQALLGESKTEQVGRIAPKYTLEELGDKDIDAMIALFKNVFKTYPAPIFDPDYLSKTMGEKHIRYFGIRHAGALIALSSAEYSAVYQQAEMTDFAVAGSYRGRHLARYLLSFMEHKLSLEGCQTYFTIARLRSLAMNKTFMNMDYRYCGTLINNTQIAGSIESMNVWYKKNNI